MRPWHRRSRRRDDLMRQLRLEALRRLEKCPVLFQNQLGFAAMARGRFARLFLGSEDDGDSTLHVEPPPSRSHHWSRRKAALAGVAGLAVVAAFFFGGYLVADDSAEVSDLNARLAEVEDELAGAENQASLYSDEVGELEEAKRTLQGQLHAERSLNGKTTVAQDSEFESDFPWETAGTVGYLTMKPIGLEQAGDKWILTVEAKNEGNEPESPFCGDAGAALGDGAGRTYSGEAVLGGGSQNCEELQPGLTGIFKGEFLLPADARPVVAVIYGDFEQEEEAMTWALPGE